MSTGYTVLLQRSGMAKPIDEGKILVTGYTVHKQNSSINRVSYPLNKLVNISGSVFKEPLIFFEYFDPERIYSDNENE